MADEAEKEIKLFNNGIFVTQKEMEVLKGAYKNLKLEAEEIQNEEILIQKLESLLETTKTHFEGMRIKFLSLLGQNPRREDDIKILVEKYKQTWASYLIINDLFNRFHKFFEEEAMTNIKDRQLYQVLHKENSNLSTQIQMLSKAMFGDYNAFRDQDSTDLLRKFKSHHKIS